MRIFLIFISLYFNNISGIQYINSTIKHPIVIIPYQVDLCKKVYAIYLLILCHSKKNEMMYSLMNAKIKQAIKIHAVS